VYSQLKEHSEAVADFERALQVEPGQKDAAHVQALLAAARKRLAADKEDHYAVLGLPLHSDEAAVRKAYRKLALLHHPDKATGGGEMRLRSERRFKRITEANSVLSDARQRREYDERDVPHAPFGGRADPFGGHASPFGARASPFGGRASPFGGRGGFDDIFGQHFRF